ncbi:MAG: outer membrane protein assembly factor BamA, partial [Alphaproteobacteria bacterium]
MKKSLHEKSVVKSCITSVFLASTFLIPVVPVVFVASAASAAVISSISVRGNQVIPSETIQDFAGVNFGTNLSSADLNDIFHRLSDSGMFADVVLTVSGSTLVITVIENPSVSVVAFEGNSSIRDEDLRAVVQSSPRHPYNRLTAEADAQTIAEMYALEGRVGVSVRPVTIPVSEGRVNLVFEVTEAPVSGVNSVRFIGNSAFSDRRLRGIVETNESNMLSFIFGGNTIDAGRVARDQQKLAEYYTNKGYIDFEVLSAVPELSADRSSYYLSYTVNEGFKYDFGATTVSSSINGVDATAFERFVNIREGKTYSADDVRDVVEDIEAEAVRQGLPFLRVAPNFTRSADLRTVEVNFELVNGNRVYVERIDIGGNTGTVERVIRRQFDFVEGDPFNARKMEEAADNLRALGIFGTTSAVVREGSSPDKVIVD